MNRHDNMKLQEKILNKADDGRKIRNLKILSKLLRTYLEKIVHNDCLFII